MIKITEETRVQFFEGKLNFVSDCDKETKEAIYKIESCLPECKNCLFYIKQGWLEIEIYSEYKGRNFYIKIGLSIEFVLDISVDMLKASISEDFIDSRDLLFAYKNKTLGGINNE